MIYEPFAGAAGNLNGQAASTTGLTGNWTVRNGTVTVTGGSSTYASVPTAGNKPVLVATTTGNGGAASVGIGSALSSAGLLASGQTLWFSFLATTGPSGSSNEHAGFGFGTSYLVSGANGPTMNGSGNGLGVWFNKDIKVNAAYWSGGALTGDSKTGGMTAGTTRLIVGKIVWGVPTTLTLYMPGSDLALPTAQSTLSFAAGFDGTTFNTISMCLRTDAGQNEVYDEIRFGATYQDVIGGVQAYWDLNGTTAGAGGPTPTGTWDATSPVWNTDSTGGAGGAIAPWTAGQTAVFAAGTDATGIYTVTVDGTKDIGGLSFLKGTVTLSGGTALRMTRNCPMAVESGLTATVTTPLSEDAAGRGLDKTGAGTLVLSGTNGYSGVATVDAGTLQPANAAALPVYSSVGQVVFNGGTLQLPVGGSGWATGDVDTLLANATKTSGTLAIDTTSGDLTQWAAFTTANTSLGATLGLTKLGANKFTLNQANTYSGATTVGAGTLQLGAANVLPDGTGTGDITISAGATLDLNGYSDTINGLNGAGTVDTVSGGTPTLTVGGNNVSSTFSGPIQNTVGTLSLAKTGTGTLTLSGANTYGGTTSLNVGTLQFNSAGAIGGSGRTVTAASGTTLVAGYAINYAFLNRLVENNNVFTIALGANSGNALDLSSATGATLGNASLGATSAGFTYSGILTPNGTTYRLGGGGGTLTVSTALTGAGNALVAGGNSVTLSNTINTYGGTTTLNPGTTLTVNGATGTIKNSSGITFNGGGLTLSYADSDTEKALDRVGDSAPVTTTANGGTLTYTTTTAASARVFAETIGSVALSAGQLNIVESLNKTAGSQTLTLSGLTQAGSSTVTFSEGALSTAFNLIKVTGATQTTAGLIIGPWATVGTAANSQTDYAVYDASGNIVPANITATTEGSWTGGATGNYNTTATTNTLSGSRTMNSFRYNAAAGAVTLGAYNFDTNGILNGGSGLLTISGTGAVRQQGTAPANLYITTGKAAITISAPIKDNTGALTLVKSGTGGTLILSGANTYTGDTIINAGTLQINAPYTASASGVTIATGATLNLNFSGTQTVRQLNIGATRLANGVYKAVGGAASGTELTQITGTGTLTVLDNIPPTVTGIADNKFGGPILAGTLVTYTVTFSKDMDASTVVAGIFGNAGDAPVTIGTVSQTSARVFTVQATPTSAGSLQLQINAGAVVKDVMGNLLNTTSAVLDDTTITVTAIDNTPPTLVNIVDDKSGGPVATNTLVTYTVTFSEAMQASTVTAAGVFSSAGSAAYTIGTISQTAPNVFTVPVTPTSDGTLRLQINQYAIVTDLAGNPLDTSASILDDTTITVDGTPPTLARTDIVDDKGGGPVPERTLVTYTVTFSEAMKASTVVTANFGNAGTAPITIGAVSQVSPAVFTVPVTPTGGGTLILQINAAAILTDLTGNPLDTTAAIIDDTTITVNADTTPPTPDPMTWASAPVAVTSTLITMTATTASDPNGVQYYFANTTDSSHDSGWQDSPSYHDSGLSPGTAYTYEVKARDKSSGLNQTAFSTPATATTAPSPTFPVIYEPFAQTLGALGGQPASTTGLTGNWTQRNPTPSVVVNNLTYGTLPVSGGSAFLSAGANGGAASVGIGTQLGNAGLLTSGAVLWFSYLVTTGPSGSPNDHAGFAFGSSYLESGANGPTMNSSGNGLGVWISWDSRVNAAYWSGGALTGDNKSTGMTPGATRLIVGKIQWGVPTTITLYLPGTDLVLPAPQSTISFAAGLDGTTFNTISMCTRSDAGQNYTYDEIRFGGSYAAVTPAAIASGYAGWAAGPFPSGKTLTDTNPALDFDGGGLPTGIEWVVKGDPTNGADDASVTPTLDNTTDPNNFLFVFRRAKAAGDDPNTTISVEYGSNLSGWHNTIDNGPADGVTTSVVTDGFGSGIDKVTVAIPRSLGDQLFARLKVVVTP